MATVERARGTGIGVGTAVLLLGLVLCACSKASGHAAPDPAARQTVDGISINVPRGWTLRRHPVPALLEPSLPFAVGSWPVPAGGNGCAPSRAISAQPATAALFWLYEYPPAGRPTSDFPPQPKRFHLGRLGGPFECLGVRSYLILFRSHRRDFQVHVIIGRRAGRLRQAVIAALSSMRVHAPQS